MSSRNTVTSASSSVSMHSIRNLLVLSSLCHFISANTDRERANTLMTTFPLIDGHNDIAFQLRVHYNSFLSKVDLHNVSKLSTDITRLQAGHVQTQMFAAFVFCTTQEKDAVRLTLEQVDLIRRMCTEYNEFELVTSFEELKNSEMDNKIACLISVEGGHSIDNSLQTLRMFYQLGVRSMTITHNCNTPWAKASVQEYKFYQNRTEDLTSFGKAVVEEMNRLGMIVDISHTSSFTALAVLNHTKAPVIFSHSSAYAICNNERNVPDWLLVELKKNRGLIMVNFYNRFVSCGAEASISNVADHFDHIKKVIGAESIGIGADYEGVPELPQGLEDVSKYPALIQELLRRNWTEDELAGVLRKNFLRVFEEVEQVRNNLSHKSPSEIQIPVEVVQNPCRLDYKVPKKQIKKTSSSRAQQGAADLLTLATVLLLSSMFMID